MSKLKPETHPLLTQEIVETLASKQVWTVLDFIKADTQQIVKDARLNFREVVVIRNFLLKKFSAPPTNGFDCYKATLNNTAIFPTGIKSVDRLLDGGLFTGNIYEICGLPASGKTQFVLSLMKNLVQNMEQQVYLFDTKNDFSGTKMKNMLNARDETQQKKILSKIIVNRVCGRYDLINGLYSIKTDLEDGLKLRLIIIDSLPSAILESNYNQKCNTYLNHLVNVIRYIATHHHVAFLITNLMRVWTDIKTKREVERIACGRYWLNVPNTRLKIEQLENSASYCQVTILSSDTLHQKINTSAEVGFLS